MPPAPTLLTKTMNTPFASLAPIAILMSLESALTAQILMLSPVEPLIMQYPQTASLVITLKVVFARRVQIIALSVE